MAEYKSDVERIADKIIKEKVAIQNKLIEQAITNYIGHEDWEFSEVKDRCSLLNISDTGLIFSFDQVALIEFFGSSIKYDDNLRSVTLNMSYKMIYKSDNKREDVSSIDVN